MKDKNKFNLMIGFSLIIVAFVCVAVVLYFMGNETRSKAENISSLEVQLANLISEKAKSNLSRADAALVDREPISLEEFLAKAESIYGPQELKRKDGVLWIDRKETLSMITLGAVNGLTQGARLTVFHNDQKVGEVEVDTAFDIISYVKPVDKPLSEFPNNYYRVKITE